jgi:hypothetical protein
MPNTRFTTPSQWEPYELTQPPVIFGHCWLPKDWPPAPITPNVICVDYRLYRHHQSGRADAHPCHDRRGQPVVRDRQRRGRGDLGAVDLRCANSELRPARALHPDGDTRRPVSGLHAYNGDRGIGARPSPGSRLYKTHLYFGT